MKYAVTPLLQSASESVGLESTGSHAPELVALVAVLLGMLAWAIYRRETHRQTGAARWLLPLLRAAIVTFVILLLLEPVIVRRGQALDRGRILVVLDRSRSQARRDSAMKLARKVELARAMGLLQDDTELKRTDAELRDWAESTDVRLQRALAKVESYSRFERASRLLFDENRGVFGELAWPHVAEVATAGEVLEPLPLPPVTGASEAKRTVTLDRSPEVEFTDLSVALEEAGRRDPDFVVLISDGRHNRGDSPIGPARDLGARGISVYPIGVGSSDEPLDLGVLDVQVPATAYEEDGLQGKIVLKLGVPSGTMVRLSIALPIAAEAGDAPDDIVWRHEVDSATLGSSRTVEVPFVLPEHTLPRGRPRLVAKVEPVAGEASTSNNRLDFLVTVKKRELRVLLLDGRPRWTWRYLRKLFERDEKVHVNAVIAGLDPDRPTLPRGDCDGCFPNTREELETHDLVIVGDLDPKFLNAEERGWLRDFVNSGGGLIFVAGRRGHTARFADGEMAPLLPVRFVELEVEKLAPRRLRLTPSGKRAPSLSLVEDPDENEAIWELLRPIRWVQRAESLPGADVWVETKPGGREAAQPVLVHKRFGRGNVLYLGIEESWRWRYKIADLYHSRFWSQQVDYFREEDFAVQMQGLALDTDRATYGVGEVVHIRARRIEEAGREQSTTPLTSTELWKDGTKVRDVSLASPETSGSVQQALLENLEPGRYELRLGPAAETGESLGLPFDIRAPEANEDLFLAWNEDLLARLALVSGGTYLREERVQELPGLLEKASAWRRHAESRPLLSGWSILAILLLLLTTEWLLRKKAGLI